MSVCCQHIELQLISYYNHTIFIISLSQIIMSARLVLVSTRVPTLKVPLSAHVGLAMNSRKMAKHAKVCINCLHTIILYT